MPKLFLVNISILFLILGSSISGNAQSERQIAKKLMYDGDAKIRGFDFEGALINYSSAISTDPTYADAYMKRASLLQKLGRPTQAINDYDKAIKLNPYFVMPHNNLGAIFMSEGKGNISVNKKDYAVYFPTSTLQYKINQPFLLTSTEGNYDLKITVKGGGVNGQAEAVRMAISRALCKINEEHRTQLKPEGLLTRDPRMVERKKFGQKKARKKYQFSKR